MKGFKPLMKIGTQNPLEILINHFRIAGIEDIFVVTGYNADIISHFLQDKGVRIIYNENYAEGMFTSVRKGVRAALENGNDCFLMTPVDIPLIPPYIMKAVLNRQKKEPEKFIVPCYQGKKGHPLSIPGCFAQEVLEGETENGMKSVTSRHEADMVYVETNCKGIILDMDTQEAYAALISYYNENKYPTEEQCRKIMDRMGTPSHVIRHCEAVAHTAVCIASALNEHGYHLEIPLIRAAGMLHDALRVRKKHWLAGSKMALDYGYPEVAEIIEEHMNYIHPSPVFEITEKDLICLADKLRQEDKLVTLDERLEPVRKRWNGDSEALAVIETKIKAAQGVMDFIERIIGINVYDLLRKDDLEQNGGGKAEGKPARRLILVRHGETQRHRDKVFMGQYDVPLDPEGKEQCTLVGLELQHFDINTDKIYTSDLRRARESAKIISKILDSRPEVVQLPELREISLGSWEGKFISDIRRDYPREYEERGKNLLTYRIDDEAETYTELQDRVMKKVNELIRETDGDLVIVAHSGVNRVIMCSMTGRELEDILKIEFGRGTYQILDIS